MRQPSAVIAEDEDVLRSELREMLAVLWPELSVAGEACDGIEAIRMLEEQEPDVLFLDIEMPGLSGLEVARRANGACHVVFVTAYDKYAVAAFERGALDYVVKPIAAARMAETVARLKARLRSRPARLEGLIDALAAKLDKPQDYLKWVTVCSGNTTFLITVSDICYFRAENKYTVVMTAEREALIRRAVKDLEEELDPGMFWRIHRSTLVNVNAIAGVHRDYRGHLNVSLKRRPEKLPVSDAFAHLFRPT